MKKRWTLILLMTIFFACKKETNTVPVNEAFDSFGATLLSEGSFSSGAHTTSGNAKLYMQGSTKTLVFENLKTDSGPDLRIYLSKTKNNSDFKELGTLKSTNGNFKYNVDNTINTADYKYVLIWCQDFSVLFGSATLQ